MNGVIQVFRMGRVAFCSGALPGTRVSSVWVVHATGDTPTDLPVLLHADHAADAVGARLRSVEVARVRKTPSASHRAAALFDGFPVLLLWDITRAVPVATTV